MSKSADLDALLYQAVRNNASWCAAVWTTHGIAVRANDGFLSTAGAVPRLYPDVMTLQPRTDARLIASALADRPLASVKDSYADVDLAPFGFRVLFDAEWFTFEPGRGSGRRLDAADTTFDADFRRWVDGWLEVDGAPCPLLPSLVHDARTALILTSDGEVDAAGGAIGHAEAGVVGVSNAWGRDITGTFAWGWPGIPLVAYDATLPPRATSLGPLRVWVRGTA